MAKFPSLPFYILPYTQAVMMKYLTVRKPLSLKGIQNMDLSETLLSRRLKLKLIHIK